MLPDIQGQVRAVEVKVDGQLLIKTLNKLVKLEVCSESEPTTVFISLYREITLKGRERTRELVLELGANGLIAFPQQKLRSNLDPNVLYLTGKGSYIKTSNQ